MYEKQAVQQGMVIDMLDPPIDPLMRHRRSPNDMHNVGSTLQAVPPLSQALPNLSGGGFDLSSVSSFDSTSDDWQNANENTKVESQESKKSWWSW